MRVVALISGGKDSCYNMLQCVQQGHVIVALANLKPKEGDELDSYMYQTVGHHGVDLYAEAMGLPLYQRVIQGSPVEQGKVYMAHKQDEVEDLCELLKEIKCIVDNMVWNPENEMKRLQNNVKENLLTWSSWTMLQMDVSFDAVSVGAILSDYQRVRVEHVCSRLGLSSLAYLWRRDQKALLEEMVSSGIHAILIKVAAMGLSPSKHLGLSISEVLPLMCSLNDKYGSNICGEGGEYETFTLDCPLFKKKIIIDESEVVIHSDDAFAPVGFIHFKKMHLQDKEAEPDALTRVDNKKAEKAMEKVSFVPLRCDVNWEDHVQYSKCGNYLWVSGIHGPSVVAGKTLSIEDATKNAMQRLSEILSSLGSCLMDAVMVHLFVKNMDDFAKVNSVYKTFFTVNPPARACIQLDLPANLLFQVDCLVYSLRSEEQEVVLPLREAMHVQSISHWAPANIGPYSQAIKVGDTMFVSGSIGLWPPTMALVQGGILEEASLSLQHVDRIISAFAPGKSIQSVIHGFCFVTSSAYVAVAKTAWCEALQAKFSRSEQDNSRLGVISFAVIPALPKGASVEWHVVAQDSLLHHQRSSKSLSTEEFNVDVQSMAVTGRMNKSAILNCVIESTSARCDLEQIMDCFVGELKNCASEHDLSFSDLMYTRIFYVKSVMEHWNALHVIQECLERSCVSTPTFSLVPVDALERDQVKMVFACLLQRPDVDTETYCNYMYSIAVTLKI